MKGAGKAFSCPWSLFTSYLTKELYHWEKTHPKVITLLTANIVWTILIPQM